MTYRTKTYIAGDWTGDNDLIQKIYEWNDREDLKLDFIDAHELTQARDTSKPCSIKKSLAKRLDASKTFVLIVGSKTMQLRKGNCVYCDSYDWYHYSCRAGGTVSNKSFIDYECDKAKRDGLRIVVIYNYATVCKDKCPETLRYVGKHINGYYFKDGKSYWNYSEIRDAITE